MIKNVLRDATGMLLEVYTKKDGDAHYIDASFALFEVSEHFNISRTNAAAMLINASEDEPVMVTGTPYWTELPLPK